MREELQKTSMADVEALAEIKRERESLQKLIDTANNSKDKVAPNIYARVMKDYDARLKALEDQAGVLRQRARADFAKLRSLHGQLRQKLDGAQLDQSEMEFRHQIGELSDAAFEARRVSAQEALAESQRAFDEADHIMRRFLEVLPVMPEGAPIAPPQPSPPAPATQAGRGKKTSPEVRVPEPPAGASDFGTVVIDEEAMGLGRVRLVEDEDGKEGQAFPLGLITTIGRTPENNIPLNKPEVSRRHAQIVFDEDGFSISDNGSGNGTYVNGERIKKHKLADGDRIQIGIHHFFFRLS